MQDEQQPEARDTRAATQRRWWVGGIVALAVLVVATIVVFAVGGDDEPEAAGTGSTSVPTVSESAVPGTTIVGDSTVTAASGSSGSSVPDGPVDVGTSVPEASSSSVAPESTSPTATAPFVPGNGDTVPVQTVVTAPPVAIDDVADPGTGMSFRLELLEAVQGEANGPGEIAGPAVRVTVVAQNDTGAPVLLETIVVDLQYGPDRSSAAPLSGPGAERFSGELAQGATATGVYVFDVPVDQRAEVSVIVSYQASVSPVVFTGPAPTE